VLCWFPCSRVLICSTRCRRHSNSSPRRSSSLSSSSAWSTLLYGVSFSRLLAPVDTRATVVLRWGGWPMPVETSWLTQIGLVLLVRHLTRWVGRRRSRQASSPPRRPASRAPLQGRCSAIRAQTHWAAARESTSASLPSPTRRAPKAPTIPRATSSWES
jgi:hypothetical protein